MEPAKKNKPSPVVIIGISALVIAIISYLFLVFFFPEFLSSLSTGDQPPVVE